MEYTLVSRFAVTCTHCTGEGCGACRGGTVPVYVLEAGHPKLRCSLRGHKYIQQPTMVDKDTQLPRVTWCLRCGWQQVQTDVPEAYSIAG